MIFSEHKWVPQRSQHEQDDGAHASFQLTCSLVSCYPFSLLSVPQLRLQLYAQARAWRKLHLYSSENCAFIYLFTKRLLQPASVVLVKD